MITAAFGRVLRPATTDPTLPLVRLPFSGRTIYLNAFFPHHIHHVWAVFAISLVVLIVGKAVEEFFGIMLVLYVGQGSFTGVRNDLFRKLMVLACGLFR